MSIDEKLLQNLLGFHDDVGILSFYAGHSPEQAADPQPRTPLEIRNQVRDLRQRVRDEGPNERWQALDKRLSELEASDFGGVIDPKASGRGRALFVAVADGRTEAVSTQIPFAERVILSDTPYLRPLVAAYDEGRPAGILVVHAKGARLLEWALGECEALESSDFELTDAQTADIKSGPSPSNPRMRGGGNVNKERFEDRINENRHRFFGEVITRATAVAKDRGWDRLVVAGSPKLRDEAAATAQSMDSNGTRVLLAEHLWETTSPHQVAAEAWPILRSIHRQREIELVEAAKDRALSGGAGALGVRNVLNALNQGQVEHLLFQADLEVEGYRTSEGTLHHDVGGPAAQAGFEMHGEPMLIERMVERVMETGGRATPVEETAAALLGEHGGVGALLRW